MEQIIEQLSMGNFIFDKYIIQLFPLSAEIKLWAANGWLSYSFYPSLNTSLTLREKWKIRKAIKEGLIRKAAKN